MYEFNVFKSRACCCVSLVLGLIVLQFGCGATSVDPAEAAVKAFVEGKGGTVELEGGHIVTVWLENADLQDADLKQFEGMPQLKQLHLNYNANLTNKVFPLVEKIPHLEILELTESKITSKVAESFRERHPELSVSGPGA